MTIEIEHKTSCLDDFDPDSLTVNEALEKIYAEIKTQEVTETLPLQSTLNRILAEDIHSSINVPSGINSAMDGYAIRGSDITEGGTTELVIVGTSWAGNPFDRAIQSGECARIMTGALLPDGTDTVVIQEQVETDKKVIRFNPGTKTGDNVRQAGEDVKEGDLILTKGTRITPADIGLVASLGIGDISVTRKLRVAFFSTGDELSSIGEPLEKGCIYDSNRYTLNGMLERLGVEIIDLGVIRDVLEDTEQAFIDASTQADVIITTGGVSVGDADFVKDALIKLGDVNFWKVAMKPGRPLTFGKIREAYFFGLPGNPVSVMVTFYQFVQPALRRMMGEKQVESISMLVPCTSKLKKRPGRVEFQRGILKRDENGRLIVHKTGAQGSGILRSMSQANCFIILPMDSEGIEPETMVEVQPFFGIV
jgi:molybdopterin molybdotransferase